MYYIISEATTSPSIYVHNRKSSHLSLTLMTSKNTSFMLNWPLVDRCSLCLDTFSESHFMYLILLCLIKWQWFEGAILEWGHTSFKKLYWVIFLFHWCYIFCLNSSLFSRSDAAISSIQLKNTPTSIFLYPTEKYYYWDKNSKKEAGIKQICFLFLIEKDHWAPPILCCCS